MKYQQPYGVSDPNAVYQNGNPATGTPGSIPPAASIEHPQREIVAMITAAGLTPDAATLNQLARAIQNGKIVYALDTGTVNNLSATLPLTPLLLDGLVVHVKVKFNNSGQSVLNLNAIGAYPIRRKGNLDILANDLVANAIATLAFNQTFTGWELLGVGGAGARGELVANKTLYVNWNIGNDVNDGTANDAGHAVKTIQRAFDIAWFYAPSQYGITINVADSGSYPGAATPSWAGPVVTIMGNVGNPAAVVVSGGVNHALSVDGINTLNVQGVTCQTNTSGTPWPAGCFICGANSNMYVSNCRSLSCHGAVFEAYNGHLVVGNHTFAGSVAGYLYWGMSNGFVELGSNAVHTMAQDPITVSATVYAAMGGLVQVDPPALTFPNASRVAGPKYNAINGGIIATTGGGINFFPGNQPGTVSNGGVYG